MHDVAPATNWPQDNSSYSGATGNSVSSSMQLGQGCSFLTSWQEDLKRPDLIGRRRPESEATSAERRGGSEAPAILILGEFKVLLPGLAGRLPELRLVRRADRMGGIPEWCSELVKFREGIALAGARHAPKTGFVKGCSKIEAKSWD